MAAVPLLLLWNIRSAIFARRKNDRFVKDRCIEIHNIYDNHLAASRGHQKSAKRSAPEPIDDAISTKQTWIRGSWNPPRTAKTPTATRTK
ncbi:uncharacterized protein EV154DRAFT_563333 [Mucor mucedo]|uniref:uncharacterized protein n=1 Tax=Mucor mucedo TaxID=29922 RepID=UPI00221F2F14|nr:uncharacterized protein EV154DRAFT_563333 [Mucor mucedo]KAI7891392.1 hypothetical protein EV154DRAFT_563333 [Mucor mucedo]